LQSKNDNFEIAIYEILKKYLSESFAANKEKPFPE
jgi:hypothetical protein